MKNPRLLLVTLVLSGIALTPTLAQRPPAGVPIPRPAPVTTVDISVALADAGTSDAGSVLAAESRSVVAWVCADRLLPISGGNYQLRLQPLTPPAAGDGGTPTVCPDQAFRDQPTAAFCSGVLVTPNVVATSATCLNLAESTCRGPFVGAGSSVRAVFDLASINLPPTSLAQIPANQVYTPSAIRRQTVQSKSNWVLIELDRGASGRAVPLNQAAIREREVQVIGHPLGLAAKVTSTRLVDNGTTPSFTVAPGPVGQSPGSPIFNTRQFLVEGIVAADPVSWLCPRGAACCRTMPQPGQGTATTVIRSTALVSAVCASGTLCGSTCVNTLDNSLNCGRCGVTCNLPNANSSSCRAGGCRIDSCREGWADCDRVASNGCETQLNTKNNCGACGNVCNLANASEECGTGTCRITTCDPGFENCDGNHANGCEVRLGTTANCAGCGDQCQQYENTIASCTASGCRWACAAGWSDCDGRPGCEARKSCSPSCTAASCNDDNPCTDDVCDPSNGCTHTNSSRGTPCNDGNACTLSDVCNGGGACGGTQMVCNSPPNQCFEQAGACQGGVCNYTALRSGTSCNDGNACTVNDVCNGGGACGGTQMVCNSPPNQCFEQAGACQGGVCNYAALRSGTPCNDGNACTVNDTCNGAGACGGTQMVCNSPPNQCYQQMGTCSGGSCRYGFLPADTTCNDGNYCTLVDVCNGSGSCVGTSMMVCDNPPDDCHQASGTCSNGTCSYLPDHGKRCNDNNECTENDVCNEFGVCSGVTLSDGHLCGDGVCCGGTCYNTYGGEVCGECRCYCPRGYRCDRGLCMGGSPRFPICDN